MEYQLSDMMSLKIMQTLPLFDRSTKGLYPPGSTIKPMVALAGLEQKNITIKHTTFCPGFYKLSRLLSKV